MSEQNDVMNCCKHDQHPVVNITNVTRLSDYQLLETNSVCTTTQPRDNSNSQLRSFISRSSCSVGKLLLIGNIPQQVQGQQKSCAKLLPNLLHMSSSSSSVICQTTGPKPLAKRFLHTVRSRASSFNSQYSLLSLRPSSNFLRLLPCILVTSICPFIFPSITCFRRQFLCKM